MQPSTKEKFDSIDIMRGIAILMVILVHTVNKVTSEITLSDLAQYGQMGVQMFFLASAFTLCHSIDGKPLNKDTLRHFYLRRFFRIAPGYYIGILLYFCLDLFYKALLSDYEWNPAYSPVNIAVNVFFLNGLYPPANNNVVPGGWSIGTEMLFYLLFPALFKAYRYLTGKSKASIFLIPLAALSITLLVQSMLLNYLKQESLHNNSFLYFNILNQLPVFCVGISMYFAYKEGWTKRIKLHAALLLLFLFGGFSGLFFFQAIPFSLNFALAPFFTALSFVFVFVLLQEHGVLRSNLIKRVGVLSYSCYLLHFVFAFYVLRAVPKATGFGGVFMALAAYAAIVVLTYLVSKVMYRFIEQPGIHFGKKVINAFFANGPERGLPV